MPRKSKKKNSKSKKASTKLKNNSGVSINQYKKICKNICKTKHKGYDCGFKKDMCVYLDDEYRMKNCNVDDFYKQVKKLGVNEKIKLKRYGKSSPKECEDVKKSLL